MRYVNIMNEVYLDFLERKNGSKKYQLLKDEESGKYYFKKENNPEQVLTGYIRQKKEKTFICLGLIDVNKPSKSEVLFCRIFSDCYGNGEKKCYIEQGFVEPRKAIIESLETLNKCKNQEEMFHVLKAQGKTLHEICSICDILNLPFDLEITEKYMCRRTVPAGERPLDFDVQNSKTPMNCQLIPLSDKEKSVLGMIYRVTEDIKKELEEVKMTSEKEGKPYILK